MALNKEPSGDAVLRSRLRSAVRRERADIAALRADIASASVAFERGKNALEVALQSTPLHPNPSSQGYRGAAEEDDAALARSLQAQIVATQDGLARVEQKERSLLAEVKALSAELRETEVSGGVSTSIECVQSVGTAMQQLRAAAITARRGDDAAREFGKWREHSLPNLSVMSVEGGDSDTPMSGVIVDRVFDGIVAFTAGQDRMLHSASALTSLPSASKDHEVVSCAAELTELTDRSLLIRVASGYSSMTVEDAGGTSLRIVSLTPTLECVQRLLKPHVAGAETSDVSRASLANAREAKATGVSVAHVPDVQKPSVTPAVRSVTPPARRAVVSDLTPRLSHSSRCISDAGFARVLQAAPARYHDCDLQRLYCTDTDGISMVTLLKKVANRSPVFILVRDASGHAFGCYGSTAWRDSCKATNIFSTGLHILL